MGEIIFEILDAEKYCVCVFLNEMELTHTHPATVVTLLVDASRRLCSNGNSAGSDQQQGAPRSAGRISIKIQVSARRSGAHECVGLEKQGEGAGFVRGPRTRATEPKEEAVAEDAVEAAAGSEGGF